MSTGRFASFVGIAIAVTAITHQVPALAQQAAPPPATDSGVIRVKSAYGIDDALVRIKKAIATKGLRFFDEIDQAQLAGIQFLTANPYAGLDWPVRMLVFEDATGQVWISYSDFAFIANRHHTSDRPAQFKVA